jgi:hypothetical protein
VGVGCTPEGRCHACPAGLRRVDPQKSSNNRGALRPQLLACFRRRRGSVTGDELGHAREDPTLQRKLYRKAKAEPAFSLLPAYDKICRDDILEHAYVLARTSGCARGWMGRASRQWRRPGRGVARRHQQGPDCEDVSAGLAVARRMMIPKTGRGEQPLGIRRFGTEWCKLPPSCCWSRSSRRISTCIYGYRPRRAGPTRSRRACPAVSRLNRCRGRRSVEVASGCDRAQADRLACFVHLICASKMSQNATLLISTPMLLPSPVGPDIIRVTTE